MAVAVCRGQLTQGAYAALTRKDGLVLFRGGAVPPPQLKGAVVGGKALWIRLLPCPAPRVLALSIRLVIQRPPCLAATGSRAPHRVAPPRGEGPPAVATAHGD